jgi:hypothetical protein
VWQVQQIIDPAIDDQDYGELELQLDGTAAWYLARKEVLPKQQAAA